MENTAIFVNSGNDIPEWARRYHNRETTTDITKLKVRSEKLEVKMKLCCNSCVEKIGDKIRGMPGVFDFTADKTDDLLTVYELPGDGPDHKQLLKKLRKIDKRAKIVDKADLKKQAGKRKTEGETVDVAVPFMTPWNPQAQGILMWPMIPNYNYMQHRVSCGQCLAYTDAVCGNCGRKSE